MVKICLWRQDPAEWRSSTKRQLSLRSAMKILQTGASDLLLRRDLWNISDDINDLVKPI
ncbi:hypothetical protein LNN85_03035 [Klebsiella pneumoniae subsp. pneumoniae]|nr:hypothetical protein [Klebsiella pneumoniae subsp. pneumoniae]